MRRQAEERAAAADRVAQEGHSKIKTKTENAAIGQATQIALAGAALFAGGMVLPVALVVGTCLLRMSAEKGGQLEKSVSALDEGLGVAAKEVAAIAFGAGKSLLKGLSSIAERLSERRVKSSDGNEPDSPTQRTPRA